MRSHVEAYGDQKTPLFHQCGTWHPSDTAVGSISNFKGMTKDLLGGPYKVLFPVGRANSLLMQGYPNVNAKLTKSVNERKCEEVF